jgi:hypothetical protein
MGTNEAEGPVEAGVGNRPSAQAQGSSSTKRSLLRPGNGGGRTTPPSQEVILFQQRQAAKSRPAFLVSPPVVPDWIGQMPPEKRNPEAIIDEVIQRAAAQPDEQNLRLAQIVLNELGRDPKVTALIRAKLTPDVMLKVMADPHGTP